MLLAAVRSSPEEGGAGDLLQILLAMPTKTFKDGDPNIVSTIDYLRRTYSDPHPWMWNKFRAWWMLRNLVRMEGLGQKVHFTQAPLLPCRCRMTPSILTTAASPLLQCLHQILTLAHCPLSLQATLQRCMGMYRGDKFRFWLRNELEGVNVPSLGKLKAKCSLDGISMDLVSRVVQCSHVRCGLVGQAFACQKHSLFRRRATCRALCVPPTRHSQIDAGSVYSGDAVESSSQATHVNKDQQGVEASSSKNAGGLSKGTSGVLTTLKDSTVLKVNPEAVLVIVAADVTTSTKAALSWARPKPGASSSNEDIGKAAAITSSSTTATPPQIDHLFTASELYWENPGEQMYLELSLVLQELAGGGFCLRSLLMQWSVDR